MALDRLDHAGMAMAHIRHGDAGDEVQMGATDGVKKDATLGARDLELGAEGGRRTDVAAVYFAYGKGHRCGESGGDSALPRTGEQQNEFTRLDFAIVNRPQTGFSYSLENRESSPLFAVSR